MTARPLSDDLYVLKFLAGEDKNPHHTDCEYRLLCSGLLSSKAELNRAASRFLLSRPFKWIVASDSWDRFPMYEWPLETVIQFRSYGTQRQIGPTQYFYPPDDELAHDLAALLTLINRRLVTVAGSSSKSAPGMLPEHPPMVLQTPLFTRMNLTYWPQQPHIIHRQHPWDEDAVAVNYNPNPKAVDGDKIATYLLALPRLKAAKSLVLAARLYAQAMALVHQEPDMAYLLITMAIETVASQAIDGSKTDEEIGKSVPAEFRASLEKLGANEQQVRTAMIQAVPQHGRPTYQFRAFAEEYQSDHLFAEDDLFRTGAFKKWLPTTETVKAAAQAIYRQRSKFVHEGHPYPASIALGSAARLDSRAFQFDREKGFEVPPLAWAERLAHVCIMNYWHAASESSGKPSDGGSS